MKKTGKDKAVWILFAGSVGLCWLFVMQYGVFGSQIDWISQHSVFPDYFRQRFYDTGSLFPDIAWNLGGGQNIYHFAYYGLWNPVLLVSYALPFVRMDDYIIGSSILCYSSSAALFYHWLSGKKIPGKTRFLTACLFALAAPLIYHSYNQLMFVNYMPFLCLSLCGTDRYFQKKKRGMLLAGIVGMILTSFYFSIGGMAALVIYAMGEYLIGQEKWKGIRFLGNLFLGVMLCGILLVPAGISLLSGRAPGKNADAPGELLSFVPMRFLYSPYGIGLTSIALVALIGCLICSGKRRDRVISGLLLLILTVPMFGYILNGGLYVKDKVFIPFLPLICLQTARYTMQNSSADDTGCLTEGIRKQARRLLSFLPYLLVMALLISSNDGGFEKYRMYILAETVLMLVLHVVSVKHPNIPWQIGASCILLFFYGWGMNRQADRMIPREAYAKVTDAKRSEAVRKILEADEDWYRLDQVGDGAQNQADINRILDIRQNITSIYSSGYQRDYHEFRNDIFQLNIPFRNCMMESATDNPCFLSFMGVRYLLGEWAPDGYEMTEDWGDFQVYENTAAAPLIYATDQVMAEADYRKLAFPDNQTALLQRAVVPQAKAEEEDHLSALHSCSLTLPEMESRDLTVRKLKDGYQIEAGKEVEIQARLQGVGAQDSLLALAFEVDNQNPEQDMHIRLLSQTNRLTGIHHEYANQNTEFTYLVTLEGDKKEAAVKLGKGSYKITDLRAFTGTIGALRNKNLYQGSFRIDRNKSGGDRMAGKIRAEKDGWLVSSIPYDANFTVNIDGKKAEIKEVNMGFLGTEITAGDHEIEISYHAPGKTAGALCSVLGILLLLCLYQRKQKQREQSC